MFNIVLYEPLIPQNTGNIGRLCVATRSRLHLIEPLGFDISEKAVRRAGLDYWKDLDLQMHKSFIAFLAWKTLQDKNPVDKNTESLRDISTTVSLNAPLSHISKPARAPALWGFSKFAQKTIYEADFQAGDYLLFGKETSGLKGTEFEQPENAEYFLRIPMPGDDKVRCLNLAGSVHIALYEALRQTKYKI